MICCKAQKKPDQPRQYTDWSGLVMSHATEDYSVTSACGTVTLMQTAGCASRVSCGSSQIVGRVIQHATRQCSTCGR